MPPSSHNLISKATCRYNNLDAILTNFNTETWYKGLITPIKLIKPQNQGVYKTVNLKLIKIISKSYSSLGAHKVYNNCNT